MSMVAYSSHRNTKLTCYHCKKVYKSLNLYHIGNQTYKLLCNECKRKVRDEQNES
jgi:transcription elongation factor Elf1